MIPLLTALVFAPVGGLRAESILHIGDPVIPLQSTDWNEYVTVPKFDPNLGELIFVVVRLTASLEARLLAENMAPVPDVIMAAITETVTVTPRAPLYSFTADAYAEGTQAVAPHVGLPGIPDWEVGPDLAVWTIDTSVATSRTYYDCSPFIGTGLPDEHVEFDITAVADFWHHSGTGNTAVLAISEAGARLEVEYFYIPEPATLMLLSLGLCAIHRRSRFRQKS